MPLLLSKSAVAWYGAIHSVQPWNPPHRGHIRIREWGPTEIVLFEQYDDLEISKLTRRSLKSVSAKRAELRK